MKVDSMLKYFFADFILRKYVRFDDILDTINTKIRQFNLEENGISLLCHRSLLPKLRILTTSGPRPASAIIIFPFQSCPVHISLPPSVLLRFSPGLPGQALASPRNTCQKVCILSERLTMNYWHFLEKHKSLDHDRECFNSAGDIMLLVSCESHQSRRCNPRHVIWAKLWKGCLITRLKRNCANICTNVSFCLKSITSPASIDLYALRQ